MINYDDFKKVDIKMGKIVSAEKIEKAEKLLKLEVDFAEEKRTIVSGIAKTYNPEDLIGKTVPFVTNLEPREMFGIQSQGMILAAHDVNDEPAILMADKEVSPGTSLS